MTTVSNPPEIKYYNRMTGQTEVEKVYGDWFIKFLYTSFAGRKIGNLFTNKIFSKTYGAFQDLPSSSRKVRPFIEKFNININDYESGTRPALDPRDSFRTFNEFFIRRFKLGKRSFVTDPGRMPAFAEARYVGFDSINDEKLLAGRGCRYCIEINRVPSTFRLSKDHRRLKKLALYPTV
jgi:phosphatidylserine decarboxylase